jgi:hypothetical protein
MAKPANSFVRLIFMASAKIIYKPKEICYSKYQKKKS